MSLDRARTAALIERHEGRRSRVYRDSVGLETIGVGRNVSPSGPGLRNSEMDLMLSNDVEESFQRLAAAFPGFLLLSDVRQAVLLDMCHNLGLFGLLKFKGMLGCVEAKDWEGASRSMLSSLWRRQVGNRARRLAAMMTTNRWP